MVLNAIIAVGANSQRVRLMSYLESVPTRWDCQRRRSGLRRRMRDLKDGKRASAGFEERGGVVVF